jgi:hypothetical protein
LEIGDDPDAAWHAIWGELYHQGDIGEGSFVAVPHLVRIHGQRNVVDWNTYAIAATIELARGVNGNPDVPPWAQEAYDLALQDLGRLGLDELPRAVNRDATRSILALLAIIHGARVYGRILNEFAEEEILELEKAAFGERGDSAD